MRLKERETPPYSVAHNNTIYKIKRVNFMTNIDAMPIFCQLARSLARVHFPKLFLTSEFI